TAVISPTKTSQIHTQTDTFGPSTIDATPELSIYPTSRTLNITRSARSSHRATSNTFRTSGELYKSMSPDTSTIVALPDWRVDICTVYPPPEVSLDFCLVKYFTRRSQLQSPRRSYSISSMISLMK